MELELWNPEELLPAVSVSEVRFSRGFICANLATLFPKLASRWEKFFTEAGVEIELLEVGQKLKPPGNNTIPSFEFEILGAPGVLYLPEDFYSNFSSAGFESVSEVSRRVFGEYLFRRFLATLNGAAKIDAFKVLFRSGDGDRINPTSSVELKLLIFGNPTSAFLGLSQEGLERFDQLLKDYRRQISAAADANSAKNAAIAIRICQLAVPPANLIDYIRPGTVIDLHKPIARTVQLLKNGQEWLSGELCHCQGLYVTKIGSLKPETNSTVAGMSKLSVELAQFEMDGVACAESEVIGALINSAQSVSNNVSLVVNGENIAKAQLAVADGHFALKINS